MGKVLSPFTPLFVATLLLTVGTGFLGTLLSVRLTMTGLDAHVTALVMSMNYAGMILGSFYGPRMMRSVGFIRSFTIFASMATVCVMCHALFPQPLVWGILRMLTGLAITGIYVVIESWLGGSTEPTMRGRVFAVYMVLNYMGNSAGQLLLGLADPRGMAPFFMLGILFCLCLTPVAGTRSVPPRIPPTIPFNLLRLYRLAPLSMLGCLTSGLVSGAFFTLGPVFAMNKGLSVHQVSWFMGIAVFGGLLLQWPIGIMSDRFDRCRVLAGIAFSLAFVSGCLWLFSGSSFTVLLALTGLFGGLSFTLYPVAVARANDRLAPSEIISVSSALILFYGAGAFAGPLGASFFIAKAGPHGLYCFIGLVAVLFGTAACTFSVRETIVPADQEGDCLSISKVCAAAAMLDPRLNTAENAACSGIS